MWYFMLNRCGSLLFSTFLLSAMTLNAYANENRTYGDNNKLLFTAQYDNHFSTMHEYLYNETWQHKNSQLDHRNKFISLLTLGIEYKPLNWLSFGFNASFSLAKRSAKYRMDDYDWQDVENPMDPLTDHSWHTQGKYKYVNLDLFGKIRYLQLSLNNCGLLNFYAIIGFRYVEMSAIQNGQSYFLYLSNSLTGGIIPLSEYHEENEKIDGLKYRQRMWLPYYGLAVEYKYKAFSSILTFKNSFLNIGTAYDAHYMQDMYSRERYKMLFNYTLSLNVGYWITDNIRAFVEASINHTLYKKGHKGNIMTYEYNGTEYEIIENVSYKYAGMSNIYYSFGVGLTVGF